MGHFARKIDGEMGIDRVNGGALETDRLGLFELGILAGINLAVIP